jgi:hypothetical protein
VGHLLAAQPRRPATAAGWKPHVLGLEVCSPLAQEVRELLAASILGGAQDEAGVERRRLGDRGGNLYYQDNSFSCTWISMIADY